MANTHPKPIPGVNNIGVCVVFDMHVLYMFIYVCRA